MVLLVGAVAGLLASLATGGRLRYLSFPRLHVRWPLLPVAAVLVKELGVLGPLGGSFLQPYLYLSALLVLLAWVLWHFWELPGAWLVALGVALNLAVVTANGGHMPVDPALLSQGPEQLKQTGTLGQYVVAGPDTRLDWLEDWIVLPGVLGLVFHQAYSPGDLIVAVGITVVLFHAVRLPRAVRVAVGSSHGKPTAAKLQPPT